MMDVSSFDFGKDGATRLAASGAPKDPLDKIRVFHCESASLVLVPGRVFYTVGVS
jgi:hypothetical protein